MRFLPIKIAIFCILLFTSCQKANKIIGVEASKTSRQIGGYKNQKNIVKESKSDFYVKDKNSLLSALKQAKRGDIIFIDSSAKINLSNEKKIILNEGITLASGRRGEKGGALLFTNDLNTFPLFITNGSNIRVSGLRIQGPDSGRRTEQMEKLLAISKEKYYSFKNSQGIQINHSNVEISNCELNGWSHAAIFASGGSKNITINHNNIHHNQRHGLGYGICIDKATVLIEYNYFDWNRHAIAGTGNLGTSYEARYNIVESNSSSHAFDMHGGKDRKDGSSLAGNKVIIHHNTFHLSNYPAVVIRGIPKESAQIYNNEFTQLDTLSAIKQYNGKDNVDFYRNRFKGKIY